MRWWCRLAVAMLLGWMPLGRLAAQTPAADPPPAAQSPKPITGPAVEASHLDTFLLRDSKGNLVPVLGMPFEEFEQLLRLKKGLGPPAAPSYSLDALTLVGTIQEGVANFQVTATIRVRQEGWVRVPLLLPAAIVRGDAKHEGPGEHILMYDAAAGGYVLCLKGAGPQPHVVTIQSAIGLTTIGEDTRLSLTLPRATESSLRLTVPLPNIETTLTGEGLVSTRAAASGQTEIAILGPAGELQLNWRKGRAATKGVASFDVTGDIQVRVESQQSITSTARLRVRSYGGMLETFQVRLPPGMELDLLPVSVSPGYTLTPLAPANSDNQRRTGQVVEVRLDKPTTGSAEVQIVAALQPEAGQAARLLPARFEVLGAARQRGTIDFSVGGQWQLEWTEDSTVRRLDPAADAVGTGPAARFEYFKQPCGLQLRVQVRPSRISVEPTHVISVDAQLVRIKTSLKYKFRGARAAGLSFELGDWKFDGLTPADLLEKPVVSDDAPGQLLIPFRAEAALPAELELTLEAHRTLASPADSIVFALPRPLADVVAPATVVIAPADNVELTPQPSLLVGLTTDPSGVRIPGRQQPPLVYRDLGGGEPATFAAEMQVRTRTAIVAGHATARLERQQMQIEQRLDYRIAHEPQRDFVLLAPRGLFITANLQVWLGDVPLGATALPEPPTPGGLPTQRLQVTTPSEQIGPCQLTFRYAVPLPAWDGEKSLLLTVPLVVPADEDGLTFADQQLDFQTAEGWQLEPDHSGVDEFSRPAALPAAAAGPSFTWSKATPLSRWIVLPTAANQQGASVISKAWIQTWLSPRVRQERIAWRMTTAQESLRVQLPRGELVGGVQAAFNAQETPPLSVRETGFVRIDVPPALRGREFTLELWYALPSPDSRAGLATNRWRPAQIEGAGPPRRTYWQLALPANEHLLAGSNELASEMAWSADRWMLAREPLLDQRQLEEWVRASRQDPLPRGVQVYLFGAVSRAANLEAWTIHRRLLLALASGGVLLMGLAMLYWPLLRRPGALLVVAVTLAGLALAAPDLAILAGQGAVLGLLVLAGAAAWGWLSDGRAPWPAPVAASILTRSTEARLRESPSTQPPVVRAEHISQITTAAPTAESPLEVRP